MHTIIMLSLPPGTNTALTTRRDL